MIPAAQVSDPAAQLFSLNSQKIVRIAETGLVFSFPAWGYLSVTTILCDRMTDTDTLITSLIDIDSLTERGVTSQLKLFYVIE